MTKIRSVLNLRNLCLGGIVGLGAVFRLWGINFGLPYTYAPDEPTYLTITLQILRSGDLNPHWWYYPSAMFYLNALAQLIFWGWGYGTGMFTTLDDLPLPEIITTGVGRTTLPETLLLARGLGALFSVMAIGIVYRIGRRLHSNPWVAIVAALLFALSPTVNDTSHRVGPDIFALFFLLVSCLFALRVVDEPRWQNYIGAGLGAGFAFGSKYNAGIVLVSLLVAHFRVRRQTQAQGRLLLLAIAAMAFGFFLTTPFAVFDFANFWEGLRWQVFSYSVEGHSGQEGDSLRWYLVYLWEVERWSALLGAMGILGMARTRLPKYLTLISFPIAYFALVSQMLTRNERTIMLIVPFLNLCAALLLADWYQRFVATSPWKRALALGMVLIIVLPPFRGSMAAAERLLMVDSRETARVWIEQHLPRGARIALEPYAPYVDRDHFSVEAVDSAITHPLDWYIKNGFEYLVVSYGTYGRFYENRARYSDLARRYDELFARLPEVERFNTGGFEIRILQTQATGLPTHRVGARWGVYEGWWELVGYDPITTAWPGETVSINLYWRALKPRRDSFRLTTRVLDHADREVAQSSGALVAKLEEITRVAWTMRIPQDTAPGLYRIQFEVDTPEGTRIPLLDRFREPIADKLFSDPFKVAPLPPPLDELKAVHRLDAKLGDALALIGYTTRRASRAGEVWHITLYWQCLAKIEKDYTVFVHFVDSNGNIRTQVDAQPRAGTYPTSIWEAGEIVRDEYTLNLPPDLAPGKYRLIVGLYEYPSLVRLPLVDVNGNHLGDSLTLADLEEAPQ